MEISNESTDNCEIKYKVMLKVNFNTIILTDI